MNKLYHNDDGDDDEQKQNDENDENEIINIKTWICSKDKLIASLYELFDLGYNVNNIMNGINKMVIYIIFIILLKVCNMLKIMRNCLILVFKLFKI